MNCVVIRDGVQITFIRVERRADSLYLALTRFVLIFHLETDTVHDQQHVPVGIIAGVLDLVPCQYDAVAATCRPLDLDRNILIPLLALDIVRLCALRTRVDVLVSLPFKMLTCTLNSVLLNLALLFGREPTLACAGGLGFFNKGVDLIGIGVDKKIGTRVLFYVFKNF